MTKREAARQRVGWKAPPGSAFGRLSAIEKDALVATTNLEGVDAELAVLRQLIRRVASAGDLEAACKGIETLVRALRVRNEINKGGSKRLATNLSTVVSAMERTLHLVQADPEANDGVPAGEAHSDGGLL